MDSSLIIVDENLKPHIIDLIKYSLRNDISIYLFNDKFFLLNPIKKDYRKLKSIIRKYNKKNFNTIQVSPILFSIIRMLSNVVNRNSMALFFLKYLYEKKKAKKVDSFLQNYHEKKALLIIDYEFRMDLVTKECDFYFDIRTMHPNTIINHFIYKDLDLLKWTVKNDYGSIRSMLKIVRIDYGEERLRNLLIQSKQVRISMEHLGVLVEKCMIVNYGINYPANRVKYEKRNSKNFLYVGRISRLKGVDVLVKAFKELEDKSSLLTLVGGKSNPFNSIDSRIMYKSHMNKESLAKIYEISGTFILASHIEGFSYAILEAMSHGLPVIISKFNAFSEIVKNRNAGIVLEEINENHLIEAMKKISTDNELHRSMSLNALDLSHKYSIRDYSEKILELVNS